MENLDQINKDTLNNKINLLLSLDFSYEQIIKNLNNLMPFPFIYNLNDENINNKLFLLRSLKYKDEEILNIFVSNLYIFNLNNDEIISYLNDNEQNMKL